MTHIRDAIVLVVDDDPNYQDVHRRLLEKKVGKLYAVGTQSEALDLARRQFFHAAILDIRLVEEEDENIEGLALAEAFYQRGEGTGIIIVSGYGTTDRVRDAFRKYKVVDFLEKATYEPSQLLDALTEAVESARAFVEQARSQMNPEGVFGEKILTKLKTELPYREYQSFVQVFNYLTKSLAPCLLASKFGRLDGEILEAKCWSRMLGCAQVIRIGPRQAVLHELKERDTTEISDRYTMGRISGYRYADEGMSPEEFE